MRITTFLLLVCVFCTFAENTHSQNARVSISKQDTRLDEVLSVIESQTDYLFIYNNQVDVNRKVSVKVKNQPVTIVLDQLLRNSGINYELEGTHIILTKKETVTFPEVKQQTTKKIVGIVSDQDKVPIIGANIREKGTNNGTITDADGRFVLQVSKNAILQVSFIGYEPLEMAIKDRSTLQIVLNEDTQTLDEVVVVGYGVQKKASVTGAISAVKSEKLTVAPVTNMTTTLGGQLPGLISKQTRGTPGSDDASLNIRGFGSPLVIVDGAESSMSNLDPSQIESITILKDASASIYGVRGGNGVILVTTKRGILSKPVIELNASLTWQGSTNIFPATNSGDRAAYKREQHINAGLPLSQVPYTEEEIQKFYAGTDPKYRNYDWFDATIRPWAPQQNHNLSIRGGSEKIKYYGYLGYNDQETIIRNDGGHFTRYNLQSNIDAQITDRIKATVDFAWTYKKEYFPANGDSFNHYNFWQVIYEANPIYPVSLPDPDKLSYAGIPAGNPLYVTSTKLGGYNDSRNYQFRANGSVSYDFKYIKGLTAKMAINYNYYGSAGKSFLRSHDFYLYDAENDQYTFAASSTEPTSLRHNSGVNSDLTQQYSLTYNKIFNQIHNLSAMFVYELRSSYGNGFSTSRSGYTSTAVEQFSAGDPETASNSSWQNEMGYGSFITRINYSLYNRYLIEAIFRADASAKFHPDYRWGYFPGMSLGWIISDEKFMKPLRALDNMKLRLSMAKIGDDNVSSFNYMSTYGFDGAYIIGNNNYVGIYPTRTANPAYSWTELSTYNIGLDYSFLQRRIYGTAEIFYRRRDGILGNRNNSVPSSFGTDLPTENLNTDDTRGFEWMIGTSGEIGDFSYDISANISWSRSKWVSLDEPDYKNDDQKRISGRDGRWTDIRYGYISDGLFTSQEEIDALPYIYADLNGNSTLRPGDVKYKNMNEDNVLDWRDQTIIGKGTTPHWMYGINPSFRYKDFDLSMLFQGAFDYSTYITLDALNTKFGFEHRWTEKNNRANGIVPRHGSNGLNQLYSDYYSHNTSYLRLKNASLGYHIPSGLIRRTGIEKVRIYLSGTNLFTISNLNKYGVNPEQSEGNTNTFYPMQRTVSIGLNASF